MSENELWEHYNGLLLSPDTGRVRKLIVRYELFKQAMEVPGDVLECGVFKGAGLFYWLKLIKIFAPESKRRAIGFDTFGSFADTLLDYEKASATEFVDEAAFEGTSVESLMALARQCGMEDQVELVPGDITTTASEYVAANPGFRIALLHLDLDTYNGTRAALEAFYDNITGGGIVVLDEYGRRQWGESDAVDEFIRDRGIKIESIPHSDKPTAFFRKPL